MKILFVCKYNRFRSKIAESVFKKINKNKKHDSRSAGIIKGSPINIKQKKIARTIGIDIKNPPRGLSTSLLKWQDIVIIVADDVPSEIFRENKRYGKKLLIWKIPDTKTDDENEIKNVIERIRLKVEGFVDDVK